MLVILCVLVSSIGAQAADDDDRGAPCDIFIQEPNDLTLNCSRRNIDRVPEWPDQVNNFKKGKTENRFLYHSLLSREL